MRPVERLASCRPAIQAHALVALALFLAGCGAAAAQEAPRTAEAERHMIQDGSPGCDRGGNLVVYSAGDGWTFHHRLTLAYDGHALLEYSGHPGPRFSFVQGRTVFTAAEDELAGIRAALDESGFAALKGSYLPVMEGPDRPSYRITHCGKEVYIDGIAVEEGRVPERLVRIVGLLRDLVEPKAEKALAR